MKTDLKNAQNYLTLLNEQMNTIKNNIQTNLKKITDQIDSYDKNMNFSLDIQVMINELEGMNLKITEIYRYLLEFQN